jgi:type 1 glutamine amidotransferase
VRRVLGAALLVVAASLAGTAWRGAQPQLTPASKKLLFLTHAALYKHTSLGPAEHAVTELGKQGGFSVTTVQGYKQDADKLDFTFLTPQYLEQFDGLMLMTNGNLPLSDDQKRALIEFVRNGKALIGAHCASLTLYDYPAFGEMLGGYFRRSGRQNRIVILKVEDQKHPATRMLGVSWPVVDEFYLFGTAPWDASRPTENVDALFGNRIPVAFSRDRVHVLLSIDTETSDLSGQPEMQRGGDYPQAWWRSFGQGRVFYTSLGHRDDIWSNDPIFRAHVLGGIRWAMGLEE